MNDVVKDECTDTLKNYFARWKLSQDGYHLLSCDKGFPSIFKNNFSIGDPLLSILPEFFEKIKRGESFDLLSHNQKHAYRVETIDIFDDTILTVFVDISDLYFGHDRLKRSLEDAEYIKTQFLANMSHELRTPMNGIVGTVGLLLESGLTEKQKHYMNVISSSCDNLITIINDILDYSLIDSGDLELEYTSFNLRGEIASIVDMLSYKANEKGLNLYYSIEPSVPSALLGDFGRLRQIIVNLLGNAIKFTEEGEVYLWVSISNPPYKGRCSIRFEVSDTGIGISDEHQKRLFEPFSQKDRGNTRGFGGIGLGLAICKRLVSLMGGNIGVESTLNRGTTLFFTSNFSISEIGEAPSSKNLLSGKTALFLDDNNRNFDSLVEMLISAGASVVRCSTTDAVNSAQDLSYDLIIVDFDLYNLALTCFCSSNKIETAPKIVLLAPEKSKLNQRDLRKKGISAVIQKPVDERQMLTVLEEIFNCHHRVVVDSSMNDSRDVISARVLLVEDNYINQMLAREIISMCGSSVAVATNGLEAISVLAHEQVDFVFMDCQMPVMDGFEATKRIRAGEAGARNMAVPIVAMTANALKGDRERCLQYGMDDYIAKPVTPHIIRETLKKFLHDKCTSIRDYEPVEEASRDQLNLILGFLLSLKDEVSSEKSLDKDILERSSVPRDIMDGFLVEIKRNISYLQEALKNRDPLKIGLFSSYLSSLSERVGADQLLNCSRRIENFLFHDNGDIDEDIELFIRELSSSFEIFSVQVGII